MTRPGATAAYLAPDYSLESGESLSERPRAADQLEVYSRALLRDADEWVKRWPGVPILQSERFHAMAALKDISAADLEAAAEAFMSAFAKNQDLGATNPASPLQVAQEYVKRGIELRAFPSSSRAGSPNLSSRHTVPGEAT